MDRRVSNGIQTTLTLPAATALALGEDLERRSLLLSSVAVGNVVVGFGPGGLAGSGFIIPAASSPLLLLYKDIGALITQPLYITLPAAGSYTIIAGRA